MARRILAIVSISTMLIITASCEAGNPNNESLVDTSAPLCKGEKRDGMCVNTPGADATGTSEDSNGVDNDNSGNTDVGATDPCTGYEVLATQKWECHAGKVVVCVPECINNGEEAPYIWCGGVVSDITNTMFVPSISNPTEVQMDYDGGSTCYNLNN
ncbi:MAG: hypothetical protein Q7S24_02265 [bacterium]|nr:hypothetical protein [bacterium]